MAVIREHLATKGLGLHCDLQNEHAIVGNNVGLLLMLTYGSDEQKDEWVEHLATGHSPLRLRDHRTRARLRRDVDGDHRAARTASDWIINGQKTWNTGIHTAVAI